MASSDGSETVSGSSPRMRGTLNVQQTARRGVRIIPAYAGNTFIVGLVRFMAWDHPRVCGEHATSILAARFEWGSSPRMRGTLSSRGDEHPLAGIIPAYAGNTTERSSRATATRDHPRVCGEHSTSSKPPDVMSGSSPRMRGTLIHFRLATHGAGIIPAYAGNTWLMLLIYRTCWDHPRVCGEHWTLNLSVTSWPGSSPRMRGTPDR